MKLIVAGSRHLGEAERHVIYNALDDWHKDTPITEVVSGGYKGADTIGEDWATQHNIPVKQFVAEWNIFGNAAGHIRNEEMANYADAGIVFLMAGQENRGSLNMLGELITRGLKARRVIVKSGTH